MKKKGSIFRTVTSSIKHVSFVVLVFLIFSVYVSARNVFRQPEKWVL